jgi:hypothetical protein
MYSRIKRQAKRFKRFSGGREGGVNYEIAKSSSFGLSVKISILVFHHIYFLLQKIDLNLELDQAVRDRIGDMDMVNQRLIGHARISR